MLKNKALVAQFVLLTLSVLCAFLSFAELQSVRRETNPAVIRAAAGPQKNGCNTTGKSSYQCDYAFDPVTIAAGASGIVWSFPGVSPQNGPQAGDFVVVTSAVMILAGNCDASPSCNGFQTRRLACTWQANNTCLDPTKDAADQLDMGSLPPPILGNSYTYILGNSSTRTLTQMGVCAAGGLNCNFGGTVSLNGVRAALDGSFPIIDSGPDTNDAADANDGADSSDSAAPAPTVASITPNALSAAGETFQTGTACNGAPCVALIGGSGYSHGTSSVQLGGIEQISHATVISDAVIGLSAITGCASTCLTNGALSQNVTVTTAGGTGTGTGLFTFLPPAHHAYRPDVSPTLDAGSVVYMADWGDLPSNNGTPVTGSSVFWPYPGYVASSPINGGPALIHTWDGGANNYEFAHQLDAGAPGYHVFIIAQLLANSGAANSILFGFTNSNGGERVPYTDLSDYEGILRSGSQLAMGALNLFVNPDGGVPSPHVYEVESTTGEYTVWYDGAQVFTTATNTPSPGPTQPAIGYIGNGFGGVQWNGYTSDVYIYENTFTSLQRHTVCTYLCTTAGITCGCP